MPDGGASLWGPALIGAIAGGGEVVSAKLASNASHDAADQQVAAANQARAYQQQATQQAQGLIQQGQAGIRYAPTYNAPGLPSSPAHSALSQAMGLGMPVPGAPASQTPYQPPQTMPPMPTGGMVHMRAPNGDVEAVPAYKVAAYKAKGAVQV